MSAEQHAKKSLPAIRFKGFSGKWVENSFSDCFTNIPSNTLSRADLNYQAGLAKNIHYGDVLIKFGELLDIEKEKLPFISDNKVVIKLKTGTLKNGDVIIADAAEDETVGKCVELLNVNNETVYSGLHTIAVRPVLPFASKYLGYYLNSSSYHDQLLPLMQGTKVLSISKTIIQTTAVVFPNGSKEQTQIGECFQQLDRLVAQHQQKHDKLKQIKKALLEKMFPQKGASQPQIRFKGFSGDWEEKALGDVVPLRGGFAFQSNFYRSQGVPIIKISNVLKNGEIGGDLSYYDEQPNDENYLLPNGAALLAMSGATTGKVSILKKSKGKKIYQNQRVGYFEDNGVVDYLYVSVLVRSKLFGEKLNSVLVAGAQPNVSSKEIDSFEFSFPKTKKEQTQIGNFFQQLDALIKQQHTQLTQLNNIKQSLLNKMFV